MIYILIIVYTVTKGGGVTGVEFNSLHACENAKAEIAKHYSAYSSGYIREKEMLCVPKGIPE